MAECKVCHGTGNCSRCSGSGAGETSKICPNCGGTGNCSTCSGTITRTSTGEIKIDVQGHNPNDVRDVMSALLEKTSSKNYLDEVDLAHPNIKIFGVWGSHPVVNELKGLAKLAEMKVNL